MLKHISKYLTTDHEQEIKILENRIVNLERTLHMTQHSYEECMKGLNAGGQAAALKLAERQRDEWEHTAKVAMKQRDEWEQTCRQAWANADKIKHLTTN